jgi:signal transduction histidine kinase
MIAVSRSVAEGEELGETLRMIARTAAELVQATASAIMLQTHETANGLAVVGSFGLPEDYAHELNRLRPMEIGIGPSGTAFASGKPVIIPDVFKDPLSKPWLTLASREGYHAFASVPLPLSGRVIGVLNVFRQTPGAWSREQIHLLSALADNAAIAVRTAQLLDETRHQVRGLSLIVQSLRAQGHEHSNLLHAISGMLAIGEVDEALRLARISEESYHGAYAQVTARIENAAVAGFLVAESVIAGSSGIQFKLDRRSRLRALPPTMSEIDAITLLGNLTRNAIEAVATMRGRRRRVSVLLVESGHEVVFRVRDWGPGIASDVFSRAFESGYSTKAHHPGIGLWLIRNIAVRSGGTVDIDHSVGPGLAVTVRVPA